MYKKIAIMCLFLMFLTGCVFSKLTIIDISGDKIKVPFGSIAPVEGENVKVTIRREVYLSSEDKKEETIVDEIDE